MNFGKVSLPGATVAKTIMNEHHETDLVSKARLFMHPSGPWHLFAPRGAAAVPPEPTFQTEVRRSGCSLFGRERMRCVRGWPASPNEGNNLFHTFYIRQI